MANTPQFSRLSPAIVRDHLPYDRSGISVGIVHLGIGAFHRAHQAVYIDDCLVLEPSWAILGVSLRRPDMRDALRPQRGLYTLGVQGKDGVNTRIVGSVVDVLFAPENPQDVVKAMAASNVRIVSLTITEKGYCREPNSGNLDLSHPDIVHDLGRPDTPCSAPGLIVEALDQRRENNVPPFSLLSCDNLPANGETLKSIVLQFAERVGSDLAAWIESQVAFPSTMVDRIVPATTPEERRLIIEVSGIEDALPVMTEPFSQWVVEDSFCNGRPDLGTHGVELVSDVAPYETMKLRLLNGSHSAIAYLGFLMGHTFVADAIGQPEVYAFISQMMVREIRPTLELSTIDVEAYERSLLDRFANPGLRHRTEQIAMDGSQKLPQRLLNTIRDARAAGLRDDRLVAAVAGWVRYVFGKDEVGATYKIRDPMAAEFASLAARHREPVSFCGAILDLSGIFGDDLSGDAEFRTAVTGNVEALFRDGARALVARFAEEA